MLNLSEILLQNHALERFEELIPLVQEGAKRERFFRMDIKPPFADTPDNWEDVLEGAFNGVLDDNR